jgi:two-component system, response regulator, stage 0 sporulation protein F
LRDGIEPALIVLLSTSTCPAWTDCNCSPRSNRVGRLPVMLVNAYGDDERRRRATEYGGIEFISKPVDFDYLKARLKVLFHLITPS